MFARKIRVEVVMLEGSQACPLSWLDSFCMRSFTGREPFGDTLPIADGLVEVSFKVDTNALRRDMEDCPTRKFGGGNSIELSLTQVDRKRQQTDSGFGLIGRRKWVIRPTRDHPLPQVVNRIELPH